MSYSAIDGDIAEFLDLKSRTTSEFRTGELRSFLKELGHSDDEVDGAVKQWQWLRLQRTNLDWSTFCLAPAGAEAIVQLRNGR